MIKVMNFGCDNTNAPRCFLSPGGITLAISRVLRLVCQAANNKFPLSVCFNHKSMFSVLDRLKINLNQVAVYSSGGFEWREVAGGELPSPRSGLRAAMVGDVLHVTGGVDDSNNVLTSILAWDPVSETWQQAGELAVKRAYHAAIAVPSSILSTEC